MKEKFIIDDEETAREFKAYLAEKERKYKVTQIDNGLHYIDSNLDAVVDTKYSDLLDKSHDLKSNYENKLIFGKDTTENIVSIEVKNNTVHIFFNNGEIVTKPMVYWILANKKIDNNFKELEGDLHYKYIRKFSRLEHFKKASFKYKRYDTFQIWNEKEAALIYYGYTMFKGLKVKDVSILSFDIEARGLAQNSESEVLVITNTFRDSYGKITKKLFRVDDYPSDRQMIHEWCKWVVEIDPTILTGHNIFGYDLPYLQYCYSKRDMPDRGLFKPITKLPLGKKGAPIEINKKPSQFRVDGSQSWDYHKMHIYGRHIIDGMFLAVRYDIGRNYPSWGLKAIIEYEGLVKKDRQFYDASKIDENWEIPEEREKIVEYCKDDGDDSLALYDLMVPSMFYMTQSIPKPFQLMGLSASGAQLNALLVRAYIQDGYSIPKASEPTKVGGGISFGIPGLHKNVLKVDIKSMYPSIIRSNKLYSKAKDPKKYYLEMVNYFTEERFKNKNLFKETGDTYYNDLQAAQKIGINSAYGLCGAKGLNFNDFSIANEITRTGRQIIKDTIQWATGKDLKYWFPEYDETKDEL